MRIIAFVEIDDNNTTRKLIGLLAFVTSIFVAMWIIDNAGLRPDSDTSEWARLLAKVCIVASSLMFHIWIIDSIYMRWCKFRAKGSQSE